MIPLVQFDPSTLSIWTNTSILAGDSAKLALAVVDAAVGGDDPRAKIDSLPTDSPLRRRLLWLASCAWHEKRHFFDIVLTNYGARRFRSLFNLACNARPLVAEALKREKEIWFPIEVYDCPVHRRILGISEPASHIVELAQRARAAKYFDHELNRSVEVNGRTLLHLGGEAQLEGLAQASQCAAIEERFGPDEFVALNLEYVHPLAREGPYRAMETLASALGCSREWRKGSGVSLVNSGLASAISFTALSGRYLGLGKQVQSDVVSPWERMARIIDKIGPSPGRYDMSDEEAWELVDKVARNIWGRTALEEIDSDIQLMENANDKLLQPWIDPSLKDVWMDFISLRRQILESVKAYGASSLTPQSFPKIWVDRLLPWHINATPGGVPSPANTRCSFGIRLDQPLGLEDIVPPLVSWGQVMEVSSKKKAAGFAVKKRDSWMAMLEQHAPMARLMLNGRRHRLMVPPELDRPIRDLENLGLTVKFHPSFEWPEMRDLSCWAKEAVDLAALRGQSILICDVTGKRLTPTDAALLTSSEFRRLPLIKSLKEKDNNPFFTDLRLLMDWSEWVVDRTLLEK